MFIQQLILDDILLAKGSGVPQAYVESLETIKGSIKVRVITRAQEVRANKGEGIKA